MTLHWTEKRAASANVAHALQADGWQLLGYHTDQSDSQSDYYHPASWMDGIATHPAYPGVVVGFDVSATSAEKRSGTDQIHTDYERADDCTACGGSGHDLDAPPTTCTAYDGNGSHMKTEPASCAVCHRRGYLVTRVDTVQFTWPTFHGTPRGKAWHVEYAGQIIASGTGFQRAASHRDGPAAAEAIATEITSVARRCVGHPTPDSGESADTVAPTPTTASRNGVTITCTYTVKNGSVWTWPAITPRIARDRYDVIKARFGIRSSRTRHTLFITQHVDAAAVLAVLEPEPAPADATSDAAPLPEPTPIVAPPTPVCATCGDTGVVATTAPAPTLFTPGNTRVVDTTMPCPACTDAAVVEPTLPQEPDPTPTPADMPPQPAAPAPLLETPSAPPALTFTLALGQRWTLDRAFQSFDDGTIDALRALDLAHRFVNMALDAPALTIAGATVTGDHCTCTERRDGLPCRHIKTVRLLRHYRDHAPQSVHAAPIT